MCKYIFEKKVLQKVRKKVVAPDYQICNTNYTRILYKKTTVVNLRFFEKISKIKKKNAKKLRKKNRKFTTLNFSHIENVRFCLDFA